MNHSSSLSPILSVEICWETSFQFLYRRQISLFLLCLPLFTQAQPPNLLWKKTLGGISIEQSEHMIETHDGGYLIAGFAESNNGDVTGNHGGADAWLVKLDASGNIGWQKVYGGSGSDFAQNVIQAPDGGYYIIGLTSSNDGDVSGNHGAYDAWVLKVDALGTIVWQKTYGGTGYDQVRDAKLHPDGDLLIAGFTDSNDGDVLGNHGGSDFWFLRINQTGAIVLQNCFGGTGSDFAYGIGFSADGGIVLTGSTLSSNGDVTGNPSALWGAWTIKISASGSIIWDRYSPPGTKGDAGGNAVATTIDGIIVAGSKYINDWADIWLVRYDNDGNILWEKYYGGVGQDVPFVITPMIDGGFIVGGATERNAPDGVVRAASNFLTMKISPSGNVIWEKILGGIGGESTSTLLVNPDASMIFSGPTYSNDGDVSGNHGSTDIWVVKLDADPALPVTLISFTAQPKDNTSIKLNWVTANEIDNGYFEVQKSKNLKDIHLVTRIAPDEQPSSTHTYQFIDEIPFHGTSYYRLKQVDLDGSATIYPWRSVRLNREYAVFPNPTSGTTFQLRLDEPETAVLEFYDANGRDIPIQTRRIQEGLLEVKVNDQFKPGHHLLHVTERGQLRQYRIVLEYN